MSNMGKKLLILRETHVQSGCETGAKNFTAMYSHTWAIEIVKAEAHLCSGHLFLRAILNGFIVIVQSNVLDSWIYSAQKFQKQVRL